MHLREIHVYTHELPIKNGAYSMAHAKYTSFTTTLVELVADDGTVGWGETCPVGPTYAECHSLGAVAALQEMAPGLIGCDIWPLALHRRMDGRLNGRAALRGRATAERCRTDHGQSAVAGMSSQRSAPRATSLTGLRRVPAHGPAMQ